MCSASPTTSPGHQARQDRRHQATCTDNLPDDFPKQTFRFTGNISYEKDTRASASSTSPRVQGPGVGDVRAGGGHSVDVPGEAADRRVRGGHPDVRLDPAAGGAVSGVTINGLAVAVDLAAGDTVRCTFVNTVQRPPVGQLLLRKVTKNSIGSSAWTRTKSKDRIRDSHDQDRGRGHRTRRPADHQARAGQLSGHGADPGQRRRHVESSTTCSATGAARCHRRRPRDRPGAEHRRSELHVHQPFQARGRDQHLEDDARRRRHHRFQIRPLADTRSSTSSSRRPGSLVSGWRPRGPHDAIPLASTRSRRPRLGVGERGFWRVVRIECDGGAEYSEEGRVVVGTTTDNPKVHCHFVNPAARPVRRTRRRSRPSPRRRRRLRRFRQAVSRRPRRATWPSCASPRARRSAG